MAKLIRKGFIELRSNPLQATPTNSRPLQTTPIYSNVLQPTPNHSNSLQVTPTNSNPLQATTTNSSYFYPPHAALTHCRPLHLLQTTLEKKSHPIRNHSWFLTHSRKFLNFIYLFFNSNDWINHLNHYLEKIPHIFITSTKAQRVLT